MIHNVMTMDIHWFHKIKLVCNIELDHVPLYVFLKIVLQTRLLLQLLLSRDVSGFSSMVNSPQSLLILDKLCKVLKNMLYINCHKRLSLEATFHELHIKYLPKFNIRLFFKVEKSGRLISKGQKKRSFYTIHWTILTVHLLIYF